MKRTDRLVAVVVASAIAGLVTGAVTLSLLGGFFGVSDLAWLGGQTAFAVVGTLILFRQPRNLVGRILAASGTLALLQATLWRYAAFGFERGQPLPGVVPAAWLAGWIYVPMFALFLVLLPLYFPNGELLSRRWRPVVRATVALAAFVSFYQATVPGPVEDFAFDNPVGLAFTSRLSGLLDMVGGDDVLMTLFLVLGLFAVTSVVLRYRRAQGVERLQLKWFVWSIGVFTGYLLVSALVLEVILNREGNTVTDLVGLLFLLCVPGSIGIAVLRYRLYDIDRIVSRTLAYGLLSVLLGALYLAVVTALTTLTAPVAGDSPIAVAAATLLVAGAFGPARRRIQGMVDRRFNRTRYDAQQMVQGFAARMRDEVDLDQLSAELRSVSAQALEPSSAWLWLREGAP